jgi:hypothetical protein
VITEVSAPPLLRRHSAGLGAALAHAALVRRVARLAVEGEVGHRLCAAHRLAQEPHRPVLADGPRRRQDRPTPPPGRRPAARTSSDEPLCETKSATSPGSPGRNLLGASAGGDLHFSARAYDRGQWCHLRQSALSQGCYAMDVTVCVRGRYGKGPQHSMLVRARDGGGPRVLGPRAGAVVTGGAQVDKVARAPPA